MLVVTGSGTTIVRELLKIAPDTEEVVRLGADLALMASGDLTTHLPNPPLENETPRYLFAAGLIRNKTIAEQLPGEISESLAVNMVSVVQLCEHILATQPKARICIIGSESGYRGSYDTTYALAKAGLHAYVRWRKIGEHQQLVAVAPSIIADAGMTVRRKDQDRVEARRLEHPKQRHVTSAEVASMIRWLLYEDRGYTSGTVIEMAGRPRNGT